MKTIHKAYRFRLKPDVEQGRQFARIAGVCRLVWNLCLEQRKVVYSSRRITLNSYSQLPDVTILRGEYDWIREIPSQVLQQKVRDLDIAYKNFFEGRAAFPEQKKKGKSVDSFRFPQGFKIDNRHIFLPKIGWVGFFKSQDIKGKPKHMTVSRNGKHWFVSVCCEIEIANAVPKSKAAGIDMGIAKLCALSDGTVIENPACFKQYKRKLAKLQRQLARKVKFSKNFYKPRFRNRADFYCVAIGIGLKMRKEIDSIDSFNLCRNRSKTFLREESWILRSALPIKTSPRGAAWP